MSTIGLDKFDFGSDDVTDDAINHVDEILTNVENKFLNIDIEELVGRIDLYGTLLNFDQQPLSYTNIKDVLFVARTSAPGVFNSGVPILLTTKGNWDLLKPDSIMASHPAMEAKGLVGLYKGAIVIVSDFLTNDVCYLVTPNLLWNPECDPHGHYAILRKSSGT